MGRKALASIVLIVLFAGGVLWWRSHHPVFAPPTTPAPAPATATAATSGEVVQSQEQLQDDIIKHGVTPERAKLLFSLVVIPLPGVSIPPDIKRDPTQFDGTPAATYLMSVWDTLTPEQRKVAERRLGLRSSSPSPSSSSAASVALMRASFITDGPPQKPLFNYGQLLKEADAELATFFNVPYIPFDYEVDFYDPPDNGTEWALTLSWGFFDILTRTWVKNQTGTCHVRVFDELFEGASELDARAVMYHEMTHCYQQWAIKDLMDWKSASDWIKEGEATWVMAQRVPGGSNAIAKYWTAYVNSPAKAYSDRAYDGLGVFGHLSDLLGSDAVWPRLLPAVTRAVGKNDAAALNFLIQGNEDLFLSSWGSSYFLTNSKLQWTMSGPGHPPATGYTPGKQPLNKDTNTVLDAAAWQARIVTLSGDAELAIVSLLTGSGRLHDEGFGLDTRLDTSGGLAVCVRSDQCKCPDGSPGASTNIKPAKFPLSVGIEGGESGAQLLVIGRPLDFYCKQPDPKQPGSPGGGGGGGGENPPQPAPRPDYGQSQGDTHLETFDGLRYDFQVVGEYTLVRSTKDDFIIQVRQVPALKSRTVTINQAIATRIGDKRITISMEDAHPVLRVDGTIVADTDTIPALTGGSIVPATTMYGTAFLLGWADGTTVRVEQLGARVLNIRVKPSAARHGALAGLLGDNDGSPANDLIGTGDASLGLQPTPEVITHALADRWRIAEHESLFDYLPGQSTATFTDPTFPDALVDPEHVANREEAEQRCRESGITDLHLLHDCVLDYAMTNDFLFTSAYSHAQQVLAARAHALKPAAGTTSTGVLRTETMEATVTDAKSKPSFQFNAQAGDIVWIGQPDCTDNYIVWLAAPNRKSWGPACGIGRLVLPATGTYVLTPPAYRSEIPLGAYHIPVRFIRPDIHRPAAYGDILSGMIERGTHDVYTFTGHAGDIVRVSGEGCELSFSVTSIIDPQGHDSLGPLCRSGADARLKQDGTYQLIINGSDGGWGPYHFVLQGASLGTK